MIRHRPLGSGHPYATTIDQRVPVLPVAPRSVELRVAAARTVCGVSCEWDTGGEVVTLALERNEPESTTQRAPGAQTHLTAAAEAVAGTSGASRCWSVCSPPMPIGSTARYRFEATADDGRTRRTRWYPIAATTWVTNAGKVLLVGPSRLVPGSVQWLRDGSGCLHRVRFALALGAGEHVVGFGERYDQLDQRGSTLDSVVFEQYKGQAAAGRTYFPMPFAHVLGGNGWAFHVDTTRRCWFDVGGSDPSAIWVEADLGGTPDEELTVRFYEGTPATVLRDWLARIGRPTPLPDWVFQLWASGNEWNTQDRVLAEIERHRAEDIPVGVVVIEAWSDESTFTAFRDSSYLVHQDGAPHRLTDFDFPPDGAWPDPKNMVDQLHQQDVRVLLWQIPVAKMLPHPQGQARADADALLRNGYVVREQDGRPYRNRGWWFPQALLPDLTDPRARAWWLAKRRYLVDEVGIDGFKTDGGEHLWGRELRYADGRRGDDGNNMYPVHYAAAYGELLESCGKAPVTFSRAGFTGSQAHGAFWAGDEDSTWDALRASVTAGLTAAACGVVYWGWDLAGFSGEIPDAELYLRAAGLSTFVPIMQYHSEFNRHRKPSRDRTPWNIAERTGDPRVLTTFRRFAQLRTRLVGYLASQAAVTIESGRPLMRALCFVEPTNPAVWAYPHQYLLGDDLLVAPVVEPGATSWPAYLPAGRWVDVWNGADAAGDRVVDADAPLDRVPVWCRRDSWPQHRDIFC